MKEGIKTALVLIICVGAAAAIFFVLHKSGQLPENPEGKRGNTPSNLYNGGLFCEDDEGIVYFSNVYDNGALYSMKSDETDFKRLNKYPTKWINEAGNYLYYYEASQGTNAVAGFGGNMRGVYRATKKGSNVKCIDRTLSGTVALAGNYLYYQHYTNAGGEGMTLYRMKTDKSDGGQVVNDIVDPSCVYAGNIYFAGAGGDHQLFKLNALSQSSISVSEEPMWNPVIADDGVTFYYMNIMDDYSLYRTNISTKETEKLTEDRVDCFNVAGNYIYYQKNDREEPALMRCRLDGSDPTVVRPGNYTSINSTDRTVYFCMFGEEGIMYRTDIGSSGVTEFTAARNAVK